MKIIYTDGHLNANKNLFSVYTDSGYTMLFIDRVDNGIKHSVEIKIPYSKQYLTNNEAELLAIHHALIEAEDGDTILSDSTIAINTSKKGKSKVDRFELIAIANKYIIEKKNIILKWIPREQNPIT
jgi:ribonuclease HI